MTKTLQFESLCNNDLREVNGGTVWSEDVAPHLGTVAGYTGRGALGAGAGAAMKKGATVGSVLGPKGAVGGAIVGGIVGSVVALVNIFRG